MFAKNKKPIAKPRPLGVKQDYTEMLKYGCGALGVLVVFLLGGLIHYSSKADISNQIAVAASKKLKDLETPKYNETYDFLTEQCNTGQGVYCVSTTTNNPSLEIYKFLVNFREQPNKKYRMFFEVSAGKTASSQPYVYKCDAQDAAFYTCQEIVANTPTDVIRAFAVSYKTLSKDANYDFNLMVKPIGDIEGGKSSISMTPTDNIVLKDGSPASSPAATPQAIANTATPVVVQVASDAVETLPPTQPHG